VALGSAAIVGGHKPLKTKEAENGIFRFIG
jgi:hypothetical protein